MSVRVMLDLEGLDDAGLSAAIGELSDRTALHEAIAADAEDFVKAWGETIAASQHKTAGRLGAKPTGHLEDAYEQIQAVSDQTSASLLIPRASRLRAAFGPYVVQPGPGKTYLTLPAAREAYGKRAGEFDDLFFAEVGPFADPVLARLKGFSAVMKGGSPGINAQLEVMYVLRTEVEIPEDPTLIPFDELEAEAVSTTEGYLDDLVERHLT